jgi:hypothetical protein
MSERGAELREFLTKVVFGVGLSVLLIVLAAIFVMGTLDLIWILFYADLSGVR